MFILNLLYFLSAIHLQFTYCCEVYRFAESAEQEALEGHVIKTVTKNIKNLCWGDCVWLPWCFSINVRQTSQGMFLCELNNSSKKANPHKIRKREGWFYHEMTNISTKFCYLGECKRKEDLGNGWHRYWDASIKLFSEKKNWTDARHYCQSLGGDLLSITSSHENDFVKEVFLKQLSIPTIRNDVPDFGVPYQELRLNQSSPSVELKGTAGDVLYKAVDGETALYFSGKADGYADIPEVDISPDGFTITFWIKPLTDGTSGKWVHPMRLYNQQSSQIGYFYYKTGRNVLSILLTSESTKQFNMDFDVWHHFALSVNIITGIRYFVMDGIYFSTWNSSIHTSVTNKMKLTLGATKNFYGYIKRILVIKKALDINEIQTITSWNEDGPWIGLNDQEDTSKLSWSDGTHVVQPIPFLTDKPEPAISLRKCVLLGKNGKWLDKLCNMKNSFICEKRITY